MAIDKGDNRVPEPHGPEAKGRADGPVEGALLPLVRINGTDYVVANCLHFFRPIAWLTLRSNGLESDETG
jgi:hypothetical protein